MQVLKEISRLSKDKNPWAPFKSGKDFQHTVSRLVLSQSRECTGRLSALYRYTTCHDENSKRRFTETTTGYDKLSTLDAHIEKLPVPVIRRELVEGTGLASVDPQEYLERVFMCNPLLAKALAKHHDVNGKMLSVFCLILL